MAGGDAELASFMDQLRGYDYVRFCLADIHGISRSKFVPARHAPLFLENGVAIFSGVQVFGPSNELYLPKKVSDQNYPNCFAVPDLKTLHPIPWAGEGRHRVAQVFCELKWREGDYQAIGPRVQARRQLEKLEEMGFTLRSSMEFELTLLKSVGDQLVPVNKGTDYASTFVMQQYETFFMDLDKSLGQVGVDMEMCHPEYGSGQFEVILRHQPGIKGPDNAFLFRQSIKELAQKQGWQVNSMAKYNLNEAGNGCHFNFSVWDKKTGENSFYDANSPDKLSQLARYWIGGLIKHNKALCALCCPTANCYRRLHQPWAPGAIFWAYDDRTTTLRVKNYSPSATYMENRLPSGLCNPYVVLAATVAAGMDGVKNKIQPPEPGPEGADTLPKDLDEALKELEADKAITDALGQEFVEWFVGLKRVIELKKFNSIPEGASKLQAEVDEYAKLM